MNSRSLSTIAIVAFLLLGAIFWGLRYRSIREAQIAREDTRWELIYDFKFEAAISAGQEMARLRLALPFDTRHCDVIQSDESWHLSNPNLHEEIRGPFRSTGNRMLDLTTRIAGIYDVSAQFLLHLSPRADMDRESPLEKLSSDAEDLFTNPEENLPVDAPVVRDKSQLIPREATTEWERIQLIFEYCVDIDSSAEAAGDNVVEALSLPTPQGTPLARARTMVTLCRALGIPARLVTGFRIRQGSNIPPHVWVEVFQKQAWVPFDPTEGWSMNLPMHYLPVRRGADQIYEATSNIDGLTHNYTIKRLRPDESILRGEEEHPVQILSLTRLPVPMHTVMKILLLLPFAALITAFVRNVVGVQTFGTFAPSLLAMSFIYADLQTGLLILVIVVTVGLLGRYFLERLRLLMVPRLSIILTLVIMCVVFGISTLYYLFPSISAQAVLLPMVILTILIERFHVTVDEDGLVFALKLAVGTFVVAVLCYLVLGWDEIGAWVLTYPEVHFFTIAAFIILGRYAGYRLTELWRFRDLVEPSEPVR